VADNRPLTIPEFAATIRKFDPRLANVPDAELVRKVLERRPDLINRVERSAPRPPINSVYERIGGRLKEDLNVPKQAQGAATAIHQGLANIREHGPSQLPAFFNAFKQYGKPENAIGDVLAAFILGQSGSSGVPKGAEVAAPKAAGESFTDMVTRRGPGEQPGTSLAQQRTLVDNLRMRFNQQKVAGDPGMWSTASKLREVEAALREAEMAQWGDQYKSAPKALSDKGGAGANYSANDLAEFKKKWGIQ
jgi:hypothetical protein